MNACASLPSSSLITEFLGASKRVGFHIALQGSMVKDDSCRHPQNRGHWTGRSPNPSPFYQKLVTWLLFGKRNPIVRTCSV